MHRNPAILLSSVAITSFLLGFIIGCFCHLQEQPRPNEILLKNTQNHTFLNQQDPRKETPDIFFTVTGRVLADTFPDTTVFFYPVTSTDFKIVMATIKNSTPIRETTVNATRGFQMECISSGHYAFVIPASSYKLGVGSPLPYEWSQDNYSLDIAFQGGDPEYAVGAFSILTDKGNNPTEAQP